MVYNRDDKKNGDSKHSETAVKHLGLRSGVRHDCWRTYETYRRRKAGGGLRNESGSGLVLLADLEVELVLEGEGGDGGADGEEEEVQVADHDDRSLVRERAAVQVRQSAPLLQQR